MLFLAGSDPQIPYFMENGPYTPTTIIHAVPNTTNIVAIPERTIVKDITQQIDDDKKLINIDAKARSLISMSLIDDVFHAVCHLKTSRDIWNTLCVQYVGTNSILESRKINLVQKYEMFIYGKNETLSQVHQRFNCLNYINNHTQPSYLIFI